MATAAQFKANSENALASTGPQTPGGKLHSSRNSLKFGLFSTKNCVLPEEAEEYSNLAHGLWDALSPLGAIEQMFATEIIRTAWRLHRCASTEAALSGAPDPAATQAAVDRARTQATGLLQRNMAELRRLQTERWTRREALPQDYDASDVGIAAVRRVIETLSVDANRKLSDGRVKANENLYAVFCSPHPLLAVRPDSPAAETPGAKQTQSDGLDPTPAALTEAAA